MASDIREVIKYGKMGRLQILAVGICLSINMLDGFDVLVIAFTASEISRDWGLTPTEIGLLFSAGLLGMTFGSLFIAPIADKIGRRRIILISLIVISVGMLLSAFTEGLYQLTAMRILTGLGIGGILPSIKTIVSEYSSVKRQKLSITLLQTGYPIGATLGGLFSVYLIANFGWQSVYLFGGIMSLILTPVVYFTLPESLEFLLDKRPKNALSKVNKILKKLHAEPIMELPPLEKQIETKSTVLEIFSKSLIAKTLMIWTCFFMVLFTFYFVLSWTPKILVSEGASLQSGISSGMFLNIGGIIGAIVLGALSLRFKMNHLLILYMILTVSFMVIFGQVSGYYLLLTTAFFVGWFIFGSIIGLYSVVPEIYPTNLRNTGTGWAIGMGRLGGVMGPYVAGLLIAAGFERQDLFIILSIPLIISSLLLLKFIRVRTH